MVSGVRKVKSPDLAARKIKLPVTIEFCYVSNVQITNIATKVNTVMLDLSPADQASEN
jgi:hypothetical protein